MLWRQSSCSVSAATSSYYFKQWTAIRISEIQSLVGAIVPRVEFFHIPGTLNAADIPTRPDKGAPADLPYIRNCEIYTNGATPYNESTTELHDLPELNVPCLDSSKLNNNPCGEINIEYIMLNNKMKCSIISDLMVKYSRWKFIKNVLARVIYFADAKLNNFQDAQAKAEKIIFIQYQSEAHE